MLRALANLVWPARSLVGEALVDAPGVLDAESWSQLVFLGAPLCACCGAPFATPEPVEMRCAACLAKPPAFEWARAALEYGPEARALVLALKRGGRRDGLPLMARWMAAAGGERLQHADALVPVPLHWTRLAWRTFNQAAWLAQALSAHTTAAVELGALQRVRRGQSQSGLTARQRRRNVQGVFRVSSRGKRQLVGRRVVLIDDVYTTGATVQACARALKRAGVAEIGVLTLARVVHPVATLI